LKAFNLGCAQGRRAPTRWPPSPHPADADQHQHRLDAQPGGARQRGGQDRRRRERALHHRQFTNTGTATTNPFQTIERKDVGITLRIRSADRRRRRHPHERSTRRTRAKAHGRCRHGNAGPSTDKRSIETIVAVDDGGILVLGGLIETSFSDADVQGAAAVRHPAAGRCSAARAASARSTNLMVFLRPVVLRDADADRFSLDRYEQMRAARGPRSRRPSAVLPIDTRRAGAAGLRASMRPPARASGPDASPDGRAWPAALRLRQGAPRCCSRTTVARNWCCGPPRRRRCRRLSEVQRQLRRGRIEHEDAATLAERIAAAYAGSESSAAAVVGEVESAVDLSRMMQDLPAVEDLLEAANDAPIIRMLNALLTQAAKDGASDIHIEPYERSSAVRFRVDGTLREVVQPNKALHAALISRLKIMAELDIAEKRLPQDGRISLRIGGRAIDVRVSTLPSATASAPCCACSTRPSRFTLEGLGMSGEVLAASSRLIRSRTASCWSPARPARARRPRCTRRWPAGHRDDQHLTVEDPIEYELPASARPRSTRAST
jgi:hypothetical protein